MRQVLFQSLAFALVLSAFFASSIGYGRLLHHWCYPGQRADIAFAAALGIAVLLVCGGMLNALGVAFGPAVDAVLGIGILAYCVAMTRSWASRKWHDAAVTRYRAAAADPGAWLVAVCFLFAAVFLVPTTGFNPHDDLTQYLMRPYHMLRFGSVGANWFDSTGADSLGAQSWMQAFFLRYLPIGYADAFDAVVCFSLCCALLASLGRRLRVPALLVLPAIVIFVLVNPSHVNTSAIYSLALMICGLTVSLLQATEAYESRHFDGGRWLRSLIPAAVFLAMLPALKFTALPFVALFGLTYLLGAALWFRTWRDAATSAAVMGVIGGVVLGLWAAPFVPNYLASLSAAPSELSTVRECGGVLTCWLEDYGRHWLQVEPIQNGQRAIVSAFAVLSILATTLALLRRSTASRGSAARAFAFCITGFTTVGSFLVAPTLAPWAHLRYSAPILIAVFPLALLFVDTALRGALPEGRRSGAALAVAAGVAVVPMLVVMGLTAPEFASRIDLAVANRTSLWLALDPTLQPNVARLLGPERHRRITALQAMVPEGKKILAVIGTPTHLDRSRNPFDSLFIAALSSPWWGDVYRATPEEVRALLIARGIDYVIWQRSGDWVVPMGTVARDASHPVMVIGQQFRNYLAFDRAFTSLRLGPIVYRDAEFTVFEVQPDYAGKQTQYTYRLGTTVDFTFGTDPYGISGWSFPESSGVWSVEPAAVLRFDLDRAPSRPFSLVVDFAVFLAPQHPTTRVTVEVNGQMIGRWAMTSPNVATRCAIIPPELAGNGEVSVVFRIDGPPSPASLGINADTRNLGMRLIRATIADNLRAHSSCSNE